MATPHPSYPNPTIVDATCEFHFTPHADASWKPSRPGEIYDLVRKDLPELEMIGSLTVTLGFGGFPANAPASPGQQVQKVRFSNPDTGRFLAISDRSFSFSVQQYPGWNEFRDAMLRYWEAMKPILRPETLNRVGERYINRIPLSETAPKISDWLQPTDHIPALAIRGHRTLTRTETNLDDENILVVVVASEANEKGEPLPSIILDIDRIWASTDKTIATDGLKDVLERLHEEVWDVFSQANTERLKQHLSRKQ